MSRSSEERHVRKKKKGGAGKVILILILMLAMLGAGAYLGRTYLAGDGREVMSNYYEEKYKEADKMANEGDYAGAIGLLLTIGEDWASYDKVDRQLTQYRESYRDDLFEQLKAFEYQTQVQGAGNEDQIRMLLDAAPYLAGDEKYEEKLLEICTGSGDDSTQELLPEESNTQNDIIDDSLGDEEAVPQEGETSTGSVEDSQGNTDQEYDFDEPATSGE